MKKKIHPQYKETSIICACGETIRTRSTKENIHVEICSKCHPFFTGKQKLVDSAGRVDKFLKRYEKRKKTAEKAAETSAEEPQESPSAGAEDEENAQ